MGQSFPACGLLTAALITAHALPAATFDFEYSSLTAQYGPQQDVSAGSILIAREKLGDPNFAESVILVVRYGDDEGTIGLVLNRQSDVPLSRVFPDIKHATTDPVYFGGPVDPGVGQALLRLAAKTDRATQIAGDVYTTADKKLIEKSVNSRTSAGRFRLYLGYAGWAPGQLEAEIRLGAWSIVRGQPKIVFDDDPDSLWERLIRETHWQMAENHERRSTESKLRAVRAMLVNR
jgi:putative transcriptional regulator